MPNKGNKSTYLIREGGGWADPSVLKSTYTIWTSATCDYVITHASSGSTDDVILQSAITAISGLATWWELLCEWVTFENYDEIIPKDNVTVKWVKGKTIWKAMNDFPWGMWGVIYTPAGWTVTVTNFHVEDIILDANNQDRVTGASVYRFDNLSFRDVEVRNVNGVHGWKLGDYGSPPIQAIPKITIASPAVITTKDLYTEAIDTAHGLVNGDTVHFRTEWTLPTGITEDVRYYVVNATTYTFEISLTNGGASINTSGTQSGRHRVYEAALSTMNDARTSSTLRMYNCKTNTVTNTTNEGCLTSNTDDIIIEWCTFNDCDLTLASVVSIYLGCTNVRFANNTIGSSTDDFGLVDVTGSDGVVLEWNTLVQDWTAGNNGFIIRNSTNVSAFWNTLNGANSTWFGGNGFYLLDWSVHIDKFIGTAVKSENLSIVNNNIYGFYYSIIELDDDQNFSKRNDRNNVVIANNTALNFWYSFFKAANFTSHISWHVIVGNTAKGKAADTKVIWIVWRNVNATFKNSIISNNNIQSGGFNSWSMILDYMDNVIVTDNNCIASGTWVEYTITNETNRPITDVFGGYAAWNNKVYGTDSSGNYTFRDIHDLPTYTVGASGADYTDIQPALDTWAKWIFRLMDGTYTITSWLKWKANSQYIEWNGESCIIQFNGATVATALSWDTTTLKQCGIRGVSIQQTNPTVQGTAIDISNMALMDIDVEIKDAWVAIKANDTANNTFYNRVNIRAFGCARGIEINGANPANHNYFSGRIANKSGGDYGIYITNGQGNHFEDMSLEPVATTGNTGIYLTGANAYSNLFENMWIEGNNVWVTIDSSVTYNSFVGGTITANTTNRTDNGKNTAWFNTQVGSSNLTVLQPFTATDTGNASSTVQTIQNNTSFAHVWWALTHTELLNGSDTSILHRWKNAGTWKFVSALVGAVEQFFVSAVGKVYAKWGIQLTDTSALGQVWKTTDTSWNGSWQSLRSVNSISTNTSAWSTAWTDYVYLCTATLILTLPTAVGNTNRYTIKNISGTTTINTTSAQTIDGSASATLSVSNTSLDLISDGANWNLI